MSAFDPNRPPATGPEWNGSRVSHVPVEPGGTPNPLEANKSNDDPPFDFAPPEDIPIDEGVCMDEWTAEAPDEPPTGNGHDPDPADAGKLIPDRDALVLFVDTMFKNADTRGYVSLRAFRDNDKRDEKPILIEAIRLNDPDFAAILFERARQAATWDDPAVFCPPVTTFQNHQNAKTDNIFEGVDLSTECDQFPLLARHRLEALLGTATVVVESGGEWMNPETGEIEPKVHLHWRLKVPTRNKVEHELLKEARTLATNLVGGDKTNKSVVHPIRWPGSWHRKKTPRLAKIVASSDNEINLDEALDILREATGTQDFGSAGGRVNGAPPDFDAFGFEKTGKLRAPHDAAVAAALAAIPNDSELKDEKGNYIHDWNYWNEMGMKTWAATGGSEAGRAAFHEWSAKARKYDKAATDARWDHYRTSPPTKAGFGTLVWLARQHSPGWTYESAKDYTAEFAVEPIDPVDLWAKFDPPTLPRGLLPKVIEDFAFDRGMTMGCDMSGIAAGALAVCAGAIPDDIRLQPKKHDTEWQETARIWVVLVGPPSTMKSPMTSAVTKPLRRIDNEMARDNQDAMDEWLRLPKKEQRETPRPKQPRAMMMDTTIEAAQDILKDSPDGVLLDQDELSGWFGSMDKYSGARGAQKDRAFWLQAYNGGSYTVSRITRGNLFIPNLSVSILGGVQPGPLRKLADGGEDDGLLQRFIPIMTSPAVDGRDEAPGEAVFDYSDLINNLRELKPPTTQGILRTAIALKFDGGALKIREEIEKKNLTLMKMEGINRKLTSHFGKYNGIFARLCVVFHCVEHAGGKFRSPDIAHFFA
jgi:hypothetical protein